MKYRRVGQTELEFSVIAFGGMRFARELPEEEAVAAVHRALDLGINFFETGPLYEKSMQVLGQAFRGRKEEIHVCSKGSLQPGDGKPGFMLTADDARRNVDWSLETLGVEKLDLFGGWSLSNKEAWDAFFAKGGPLDGIHKAINEGLVGYVYVTSHDVPQNTIEGLKSGVFAAVTIPYNIAKRHFRPVIDYCQEHGLGCLTMQPTAGGMLASREGKWGEILRATVGDEDPALAAQRWLLAHEGITAVPVGFTAVEQVEASCSIADEADSLARAGEDSVDYLADYADLAANLCTRCGYCEPCPQGIPLRNIIQPYQMWQFAGDDESLRRFLKRWPGDSADCIECGLCQERCPQQLPIPQYIAELATHRDRLGLPPPG